MGGKKESKNKFIHLEKWPVKLPKYNTKFLSTLPKVGVQ